MYLLMMTKKEVLKQLQNVSAYDDKEIIQIYAIDILCRFLVSLGYKDIVDLYNDMCSYDNQIN